MGLYENLLHREEKLSVIGLGYVGLPLAIAFAKNISVIGYDSNAEKIALYRSGCDPTKEVGNQEISESTVNFTSNPSHLREATFHIVAVPTPIKDDRAPDLSFLELASHTLGRYVRSGAVIVFESTVYPGVTEEFCVPILEAESGLHCGSDFAIGYSPERINPGDRRHRLENVVKVVSGMNEETLDVIAKVYGLVALAGVYRAPSIRIAEAAKVIENSQRDINIAFMNELSIIFHKMGIDTKDVLKTAGTKWNFLPFSPGLVGGHCIGVDPYYLTHKAASLGYHSQVILAGRRINDDMGKYVAENVIKLLIKAGKQVQHASVVILGFTFKENCADVRNTRVIDIVKEFWDYGIEPRIVDPVADTNETERVYGIKLSSMTDIFSVDAVVLATAHTEFANLTRSNMDVLFAEGPKVLIDVKGLFDKAEYEAAGYLYWRL